jgi:hypothetical protein
MSRLVEPRSSESARSSIFDFGIARFLFRLEALEPLILPRENKGNVLRGAFGSIFKQICCGSVCSRCSVSPIREHCAYAAIFEPAPPPSSDRLSNLQDIPRPFVLRPPLDTRSRYQAGDVFEFELLLFGKAQEYFAYFIVAFRQLAESGFGIGRGRCRLQSVAALSADGASTEVYSHETQCVRPAPASLNAGDIMRPLSAGMKTVRIDYLTPTHIKHQGVAVESPEFHHLIKRLRDRVNAIAWFYSGTLLDIDFAAFGKRSEAVRTVESKIAWLDRERFSTRTKQRHPIGGFAGYAIYTGDIAEFIPLLRLGEFIHVGKHAVWGNGQFQIEILDASTTVEKKHIEVSMEPLFAK